MNTLFDTAIELLIKNTLPFVAGNESDYIIARNNAMSVCTHQLIHGNIFEVNDWYEIREELKKISYEKFKISI